MSSGTGHFIDLICVSQSLNQKCFFRRLLSTSKLVSFLAEEAVISRTKSLGWFNMDKHSQRENVLLGYSPKTALKSADIDFHDVFGGPPRRSSMQEMRYSLNTANQSSRREEDSVALPLRPWSGGLNEMPVFREDTLSRRRYPSDDFFDDIFRGDQSVGSPRRSNQDPFGSTPGSRVMSPARSLPPRSESFSRSLSGQFQFRFWASLFAFTFMFLCVCVYYGFILELIAD